MHPEIQKKEDPSLKKRWTLGQCMGIIHWNGLTLQWLQHSFFYSAVCHAVARQIMTSVGRAQNTTSKIKTFFFFFNSSGAIVCLHVQQQIDGRPWYLEVSHPGFFHRQTGILPSASETPCPFPAKTQNNQKYTLALIWKPYFSPDQEPLCR